MISIQLNPSTHLCWSLHPSEGFPRLAYLGPGAGWDGGWEDFEDSRRSGVSIRAQGPWAQGLRARGPRAHGPRAQGPWAQGPWAQGPWAQGPWAFSILFPPLLKNNVFSTKES